MKYNKFDKVDVSKLDLIRLSNLKHKVECELAWLQKDLSAPFDDNSTNDLLDCYNQYNRILEDIEFREKIIKRKI